MKRIPLNTVQRNSRKGLFALVDDEDYGVVKEYNWSYQGRYAFTRVNDSSILMHRLINRTPGGYDTDHINHNSLDNRRSNLRTTTRAQNIVNSRRRKDNQSGYKGVQLEKRKGRDDRWVAKLVFCGKVYRKRFVNMSDAIAWRMEVENKVLAM